MSGPEKPATVEPLLSSDAAILDSFGRTLGGWSGDERTPTALRGDLERFLTWFAPIRQKLWSPAEPAAPSGMVLLPREPTDALLEAMTEAHDASVCEDLIGPMEDAYRALVAAATSEGACPICAIAFKPDDLCLTDIELGTCHAECLKGSPMVDLDTGEPLPDGEVPEPYLYAEPAVEVHKLDTDQQVFFYEQDFYVLSNFSAFNLMWSGIEFPTSEHAYHWCKFSEPLLPADGEQLRDWRALMDAIRFAPSAHEAFKMAERHKDKRRPDWDTVKVDVMRSILRAKVEQHEYVRRKLLATGDRELVEDSWRDDFWGWGPNRDGQNMLGKLWMEIRAELRSAA